MQYISLKPPRALVEDDECWYAIYRFPNIVFDANRLHNSNFLQPFFTSSQTVSKFPQQIYIETDTVTQGMTLFERVTYGVTY